jgi:hypothetical protein
VPYFASFKFLVRGEFERTGKVSSKPDPDICPELLKKPTNNLRQDSKPSTSGIKVKRVASILVCSVPNPILAFTSLFNLLKLTNLLAL